MENSHIQIIQNTDVSSSCFIGEVGLIGATSGIAGGEPVWCELELLIRKKKEFTREEMNIRANNGNSLLHIAAYRGETEVVQFLLRNGMDAFEKDCLGRTPIDLASNDEIRFLLLNNYRGGGGTL